MRAVPICHRLLRVGEIIDLSLRLAPDAWARGCWLFCHEPVGFVSLGPVALVLSLRIFFVKNLLSSWYLGVRVALALTLARLLLRDFGPLVPRSLLPGLWCRCWSWVARSCSPGQITASVLVPGSWTWLPRLSPAIRLPPMGWLGWWVCVCLHILKWCLYYFMEI